MEVFEHWKYFARREHDVILIGESNFLSLWAWHSTAKPRSSIIRALRDQFTPK